MSERWLAQCLLAYPKAQRERDGGYLLDLALELGERVRRTSAGALAGRGGLLERCAAYAPRRGGGRCRRGNAARRRWRGRCGRCRSRWRWRRPGPSPTRPRRRSLGSSTAPPSRASGTLVAMRGHDVVACEGLVLPTAPRACRRVRHRLRHRVADQAVHRRRGAQAPDAGTARRDRPDRRLARAGPAGQGGHHHPQLLTHTSGLVDSLGDDYERFTRRQMVTRALAAPLRSPPGTAYHYSNVGYSLLAAIIEQASGIGYERYLARYLFRPAGMTQTGYMLPRWRRSDVAVEYDPRGVGAGPAVRASVGGERTVVEPARQRRPALDCA